MNRGPLTSWSLSTSRRRSRSRHHEAVTEMLELLAVHVAAGDRPADAVAHLDGWAPKIFEDLVSDTTQRLREGRRLGEAMENWRIVLGPDAAGVVDLLVMADRDGGALNAVLTQLAVEVRAQRRRDREAEARRLPVRLAGPLVVCVLPSFVLLGLVPLIAAALSSLTQDSL